MYIKILGIPVYVWRRLCLVNLGIVVVLAAVNFGLLNAHAQNVSINTAQDCDNNAVIWCGAASVNQLINRYNNGDGHNSTDSIHDIFNYFGISAVDINAMNNSGVDIEAGSVTRDGNVFDGNGKLVATDALTGGRQNIAGSNRVVNGGTVFFTRPPSVSFRSSPLAAFVVMRDGRFDFAILASCGNAVKATPVAPKAPPKTAVAPARPVQTVKKPATTNVCSGNTTNTNSGTAAQGGNCSTNTNTTVTQTATATTSPPAPPPPPPPPATPPATPTTSASTPTTVAETAPTTTTTAVTPAAQLVNTGPGDLVGIFSATTVLTTLGYRFFLYRRLNF